MFLLLLVRRKWNWGLTSSWQLTFIAPHLFSPPYAAPSCCHQQPSSALASLVFYIRVRRDIIFLYMVFSPMIIRKRKFGSQGKNIKKKIRITLALPLRGNKN